MAIGGPAGSPRNPGEPAHACSVNSVAARCAKGPVQPKSEMVTTMARGDCRSSRDGSMPSAAARDGRR